MEEKEILNRLRAKVSQYSSTSEAAKEMGMSVQYLSDVLNKKRHPGEKILPGLGLRRVVIEDK